MYLQITTKCNMSCSHCCYSCTKYGRHGTKNQIIDNIAFARDYTDIITIGGGEPTLHPDFFDILKYCLNDFDSVWMATNGSQTDSMYRLANIINQEDYPECDCHEKYTKDELLKYTGDEDGCLCHEKINNDTIYQEDKLTVALSLDYFHDKINANIVNLWNKNANIHGRSHFEIRNVSNHVIAVGRAKKTGAGWEEGCVCSDIMIKPTGKIRLCGCVNSPVIGHVDTGIENHWQNIINNNQAFAETDCYKSIKNKKE